MINVKSIFETLKLGVDISTHAGECLISDRGHKHDFVFGEKCGIFGYSKADLIDCAKRTGKKPLFLFPENLKEVETP